MSISSLVLSDLNLFSNTVLRAPPRAEPFYIANHHKHWAKVIKKTRNSLVMSSRGLGKSVYFSYALPIWRAVQSPNARVTLVLSSDSRARKRLRTIKREFEQNPMLKFMLPPPADRRGDGWSSNLLHFANGAEIEAIGFGSRARGEHPSTLILDDVIGDDSLFSDLVRKKSIDYYRSALEGMMTPGTEIRLVGTPQHVLDLYGEIEKDPNYITSKTPVLTEAGESVWPEMFPLDWIKKKRQSVGEIRFSREYLCIPLSSSGSLFPSSLFPDEMFDSYVLGSRGWHDRPGISMVAMGVDFAISANRAADETVIFTQAISANGTRYVIDIECLHGVGFRDQLEAIRRAANRYKPDIIGCEANAMQRIFGDELIVDSDLPIVQVTTGSEKHSLERGVPSIRVLFENGKVRAPRGSDVITKWLAQLQSFTFEDGRVVSTGAHDDLPMAQFHCEKALAQYTGASVGSGEDDEDIEEDDEWKMLMEDANYVGEDGNEWFDDSDERDEEDGLLRLRGTGESPKSRESRGQSSQSQRAQSQGPTQGSRRTPEQVGGVDLGRLLW